MAWNVLNERFYNALKISLSDRLIQGYFPQMGKQWKLLFSIMKHYPLLQKEIFTHFFGDCVLGMHTETRQTAVEEVACALKGLLHTVISDNIPLRI